MSPKLSLLALLSLVAALLLPAQASALPLPAPDTLPVAESLAVQPRWTVWGAEQYALADDGASIWIGAVGGVAQWDKQTGTYRRYSSVDGLPQTQVLAITVDAAGNRWFGGIGGLSRLDKDGNWTHYTTANSGLRRNDIDALAVVGGDTLYIGHGPDDGSVSRLAADGTWQWFPNRAAAIVMDYAAITSRGSTVNALWTVAGAEVWAGKWAFDGAAWHDRSLPDGYEIVGLAADGQNHVWACDNGRDIYEWDGQTWVRHSLPSIFSRHVTALVADQAGKVWAGLTERTFPYTSENVVVREATGNNGHSLDQFTSVTALLSTSEGVWATGAGWLMTPDFMASPLTDQPGMPVVRDALASASGALWLTSSLLAEDYWTGGTQVLDDQGTLPLDDDVWQHLPGESQYSCGRVTALERSAADIWYAAYCYERVQEPAQLVRYRGGMPIVYQRKFPIEAEITDIFAQNERRTWFGLSADRYNGNSYVMALDDGGTPADFDDDQWQTLALGPSTGNIAVAVDAQGHVWRGQVDGLYRYDGAAWQRVYDGNAVCDLAPTADGTMFAQIESSRGAGCATYSDRMIVVSPDGAIRDTFINLLLDTEKGEALARTATRRNSLWTISADGALWYVDRSYPDNTLRRLSRKGAYDAYPLPVSSGSVRRLEVDARGHVWLVAEGKLWRMEGPAIHRLFLPTLAR